MFGARPHGRHESSVFQMINGIQTSTKCDEGCPKLAQLTLISPPGPHGCHRILLKRYMLHTADMLLGASLRHQMKREEQVGASEKYRSTLKPYVRHRIWQRRHPLLPPQTHTLCPSHALHWLSRGHGVRLGFLLRRVIQSGAGT